MKCPKCSYISFDDNQVCPECNRDISTERARMNLPSYRSNPPSLLDSLFEKAKESSMNTKIESQAGFEHLSPEEDTNESMEL
jgi:hypothetical protein